MFKDIRHPEVERLIASGFFKNADAIYFDFDGVVAHTEPPQMEAFKAIAERHSPKDIIIEFHELVREMIGKPERVILDILKHRHEIPTSLDELLELRAAEYVQAAKQKLQPNPHALEVLEAARELGIPCHVLSNGRAQVLTELNMHWDIHHYFGEMHTIDTRKIADKVDFLRSTGIPAGNLILIEDSVSTATKAGDAGVNAVYSSHWLNPDDFVPNTGIIIPCVNEPSRRLGMRPKRVAGQILSNG